MARKLLTHEESMRVDPTSKTRTYAIHSDSFQEEPDVHELGELMHKVLRGIEANEGTTAKVLGLRVSTWHYPTDLGKPALTKPYRHEVEVKVKPAWEGENK